MSAGFRQAAGATQSRIRRYASASYALPNPMPTDVWDQMKAYEAHIKELDRAMLQLTNALRFLEEIDAKWRDIIEKATGAEKEAEQQAYDEMAAKPENLLKDMDDAREALVNLQCQREAAQDCLYRFIAIVTPNSRASPSAVSTSTNAGQPQATAPTTATVASTVSTPPVTTTPTFPASTLSAGNSSGAAPAPTPTALNANQALTNANAVNNNLFNPMSVPPPLMGQAHMYSSLPKMQLPTFNGNIKQWPSFWAAYEAAVHNQPLPPIQKLTYLIGLLKDQAKEAVEGYALTPDNYQHVITALKDRFARSDRLRTALFAELQRLPAADAKNVRPTLASVQRIIRQLETMQENIATGHYEMLIETKMPLWVLNQLYVVKDTAPAWDIHQLLSCLEKIVSRQETAKALLGESHEKNSADVRSKAPDRRPKGQQPNSTSMGATSALLATTGSPSSKKHSNEGPRKPKSPCAFCGELHYHDKCDRYSSVQARQARIKEKSLCFRCLKTGHRTNACTAKPRPCFHCKGSHHSALCQQGKSQAKTVQTMSAVADLQNQPAEATQCHGAPSLANSAAISSPAMSEEQVLVPCKGCKVVNMEKPQLVRDAFVFFDSGASRSFIVNALANQLQLKRSPPFELEVSRFGQPDTTTITTTLVHVGIRLVTGGVKVLDLCTVPFITLPLPEFSLVQDGNSQGYLPVSPSDATWGNPDILLGSDLCFELFPSTTKTPSGFTIVETSVGPILTGKGFLSKGTAKATAFPVLTCSALETTTRQQAEDFWQLETLGITDNPYVSDDDLVMQQFQSTVHRLDDGRYEVYWPWRSPQPNLAYNLGLSLGRLRSTWNRLHNEAQLLQQYDNVFKQQLENGIIEIASTNHKEARISYLPHQPVITPSKATTKLRVVFDASAAKKKGTSLNSCLFRGPVLLPNLVGILLRWRTGKFILLGDIEKAFLQVSLAPEDRDVTRFLWLKDPKAPPDPENIVHYRFRRIPFGVVSSPFLLSAVVQHHLQQSGSPFASEILQNTYVDNIILSTGDLETARGWYSQLKTLFAEAKMNIREFASNSEDVRRTIPAHDQATGSHQKVLGLLWNIPEDSVQIALKVWQEPQVTKRNMLAFIQEHFDPLGLLSPIFVPLKLLWQSLWKDQIPWDASLEPDRTAQWQSTMDTWKNIVFRLPRASFASTNDITLHAFVDASQTTMAAVIYGVKQEAGQVTSQLLFSKTRLMPLKRLTIPRAELVAASMGAQALRFVQQQLGVPLENCHAWSDSKCVLYWLRTANDEKLPTFVRNRVRKILTLGQPFRYVPSACNPADIASRGVTPALLQQSSLWWEGPPWICQHPEAWPEDVQVHQSDLEKEAEGTEPVTQAVTAIVETQRPEFKAFIDPSRFSSWYKMWRTTMRVLEFLSKPQAKTEDKREVAENLLLKQCQLDVSQEDIDKWGLRMNKNGIWEVHGRLGNFADLRPAPIFMPRKNRITALLILQEHAKQKHAGPAQTLANLRLRFWIPQGRHTVRNVLHKECFLCRRWTAKPFQLPPMPDLPGERLQKSTPFQHTGLDYAGPLLVKSDSGQVEKLWICLFTCLATRAVHLEIARGLSAAEFMSVFKRFSNRRGVPDTLLSDNGTQFLPTAEFIPSQWHNITALSPWKGGLYERLNLILKSALRKAIGKRLLTSCEMTDLVIEIEGMMNSRPIVQLNDETNEVLRPIDFLVPHISMPQPEEVQCDDEYLPQKPTKAVQEMRLRFKKTTECLDKLWQFWQTEYLNALLERTQKTHRQGRSLTPRAPRLGEVVLVHEEDTPRGLWRTARILELVTSKDHHIRSAKIQVDHQRPIWRPINLLYPLEVTAETAQSAGLGSSGNQPDRALSLRAPFPNVKPCAPQIWKFFVMLLMIVSQGTQAIIGYDCSHKNTNITTIDATSVGSCEIARILPEESTAQIQLVQLVDHYPVDVYQCKISVSRHITHCGLHSHSSEVLNGHTSYIHTVNTSKGRTHRIGPSSLRIIRIRWNWHNFHQHWAQATWDLRRFAWYHRSSSSPRKWHPLSRCPLQWAFCLLMPIPSLCFASSNPGGECRGQRVSDLIKQVSMLGFKIIIFKNQLFSKMYSVLMQRFCVIC